MLASKATIRNIISLQFSVFPWKFKSPQVKQYLISTIVNSVYYSRLRFRILGSQEIKIKLQNSVETQAIFPSK